MSRFLYSPAGQSTQMIVGADASSDNKILTLSHYLYDKYKMRRVYYSAFSPIPHAAQALPAKAPPLIREHRLYQADWLLRFYGFSVEEITVKDQGQGQVGMLDLDIDPKLAWAIRNRGMFPININIAEREALLRIPGIGVIGASKIIHSRKFRRLRFADLAKCGVSATKVSPFIETCDYSPNPQILDSEHLKAHFTKGTQQMRLFD